MYKLTRVFIILAVTFFAFVMLGSTLAAASTNNSTTAVSIPNTTITKPAALNTAAWDTQFGSPPGGNGVDGEVVAIAEDGNGNLYVGGAFHQVGSTTAHNIAMWDGSSWSALIDGNGWNGVSGDVWAIAIDPASGDVYMGGLMARIDGNNAGPLACRIARWSPSTSTWSTLADGSGFIGTDGTVHSLEIIGNELFVGGSFDGVATSGSCGTLNVAAPGLASWNIGSESWSDVGGSMAGFFPQVYALTSDGTDLFAGGTFSTAGGVTVGNVAKWNGSNWSDFNGGIDGEVKALTWDAGMLYAGGTFTQTVADGAANYIAQWDGFNWSGLGDGIGGVCMPGLIAVKDVLVQGSDLYATGLFQSAGGTSANNIAHWDTGGQTWSAMGDGLGIHPVFPCEAVDYVNTLAWGSVYAGGTFTNAGSTDSVHFGRWLTSVPTNGVTLSPQTAVSSAAPNSTVTYTLQIRNTGSQTDSYTITMGSVVFPTQLSINQAHLAPNETETAVITVTIPPSANGGDSDSVTITATSQTDGNVTDSSQLTTNVVVPLECQVVVDEPFLDNTIPANWAIIDIEGSSQVWRFDDSGGRTNLTGGSGNFAIVDSDNYGNGGLQDTALIAPSLDFSSATAVSLTFKTDFRWFSGGSDEKADVDVSINGGANWTTVWQKIGADYRGPATETIDISTAAAGHGNVLVRFHYYDAAWDYWWQVDDVEITRCAAPIPSTDFSFSKDDGGITAVPSDTISYILTYDNVGGSTATNVTLNETVPPHTTFNIAASSAGWNCADNSPAGTACQYAVGSVNAGNGGNAVFGVTLDGNVAVTMITNTAVLTDDNGASIPASDNTPILPLGIITGQKFYDFDGNGSPIFPRDYAINDYVKGSDLGDINGDGHMDMAVATQSGVNLLFGRGDGSFAPPIIYPISGGVVFDVGIADLNNDGWPDMAVLMQNLYGGNRDRVQIYLGRGGGVFIHDHDEYASSKPDRLLLADLSKDGIPDIILTHRGQKAMSTWFGKGDGTFPYEGRQMSGMDTFAFDISIADYEGDGDLDIVTAHFNAGFTVWENPGNGLLIPRKYIHQPPLAALHVAWADVDGDGDLDVVHDAGLKIVSAINDGGVFTNTAVSTNIPFNVRSVILTDTNGDNKVDLLLAYSNTVSIRTGDGTGAFTTIPTTTLSTGINPINLLLHDLDGDGHEEIITVNQSGQSISRYFGDGSGSYDYNRADTGLPNWTIFLDQNGDDQLTAGEPFSITNSGGYYTFTQLTAGTYHVREVQQAGWVQTSPTTPITIANGLVISNHIGNYELNVITGTVYDDQNQNQVRDAGEPAQAGWKVYLDDNNNGRLDGNETFTTTDSLGRYFFTDLPAKTYFVRIVLDNGWKATTPYPMILPAISGQTRVIDFGTTPISINGRKFDDHNGDGEQYAALRISPSSIDEVVLGDINGDGNQDSIALIFASKIELATALGRGDGSFMPYSSQVYATLPISSRMLSLSVDDINGDHLDDVVVTVRNGQPPTQAPSIYIFYAKGDGTFQSGGSITLPETTPLPYAVLANLNQDKYPDLAITNSPYNSGNVTGTLYIYTNDGTGRFKLTQSSNASMEYSDLIVEDMNGNGRLDLLTFGQNGTVWINNGQAQFTPHAIPSFGSPPFAIAVGDINGINGPDIVYQRHGSVNGENTFYILRNNGSGTVFSTTQSVSFRSDGKATRPIIADLNDDGKMDMAVSHQTNATSVLFGNGDGTFQTATRYALQAEPSALLLTDLNNDGATDFVAPHYFGYYADLMLNDGTGQFTPHVEPGLPNWTIFLDNNSNDILDSGDISTTTDANGYYTFTVPLTSYRVREVNQQDWVQTSISPTAITPAGEDIADVDFGNFKLATITGTNYHDLNANLRLDAGESGLSGWTVFLDDNDNGQLDAGEVSTTTNASGIYTFTKLGPGVYNLRVVTQTGWTSSHPVPQKISPVSGQIIWTHLGHYQPANIGDKVWLDNNADGIQDNGELGIGGVTTTLHLPTGAVLQTTATNAAGLYTFTVKPSNYYVSFTLPSTYLFSPQNQTIFNFNDSDADVVTGKTAVFTTTSGVDQPHWDAGMYRLATVGDRVWSDANYDGTQNNGEIGVGGVTVTLYLSGTTTIWRTTTTNNNGDYSFAVVPGSYWIKFTRPTGFIFTHQDIALEDEDSDVDAGGNSDPFTLYENNTHPDLDAGVVKRATVGNRVWFDVNGDGIQEVEEPGMSGITVTLRNGTGIVDTEITDGDGYYTFTQVTPGNYYIHIPKPTGWEYSPKQNPAAPDNDHDSDVDETSGETDYFTLNPGQVDSTQDGGMFPLPATIGDRVWHDVDGDGIQDAGESGVAGATVGLYFVGSTFPHVTTTSDASGLYTFTNVLPNNYFLSFSPPNGYYLTARDQGGDDALDSDADSAPSSPTYAQTISFTVSAGDIITTWDAGVYQLGSIGDRVWLEYDHNGIQNITETYNPGNTLITVTLTSGNFVISTTHTDVFGYYTFTNLFPGNYVLEFPSTLIHNQQPLGLSPQDQGSDDALDSDANPLTGKTAVFTLTSGQNRDGWDAGYTYLHMIDMAVERDDNLDTIADGQLSTVTVHLRDAASNTILETRLTNNNGGVTFEGWWTGNHVIQVEKPLGFLFTPKQLHHVNPETGLTDPFSMTSVGGDYWVRYAKLYQPTSSGSILPSNGGTVQFTNGQGNQTAVVFLPSTVTSDTIMYLTNLVGGTAAHSFQTTETMTPIFNPPEGYATTSHIFYLDAEQDGWQTPNLTFNVPSTLTIEYSDTDVAGLNENNLALFYWDWDSETWMEAETVCAATSQVNVETNTFTTGLCKTGRYALFGQTQTGFEIYLPMILQ